MFNQLPRLRRLTTSIIIATALLLALLATIGWQHAHSGSTVVVFDGNEFAPAVITITVGSSVTWENNSGEDHTLEFGAPYRLFLPAASVDGGTHSAATPLSAIATPNGHDLPNGGSYGQQFDTVGSFPYYLSTAPDMVGLVVVEAAPGDAPTAAMAISGTLVAGSPVLFDGALSTDPEGGLLTYAWSFGDGGLGSDVADIAHIYMVEGDYEVALTVADPAGLTDTTTQTITILPPIATLGVVNAYISVTNAIGTPLSDVTIKHNEASLATTDANGEAIVDNLSSGLPIVLTFDKDGYVSQIVRLTIPLESPSAFAQIIMLPVGSVESIPNAAAGGTAAGVDGASVTLPPSSLVDSEGVAVTGAVDIAITPIDVSGAGLAAFPGGFDGLESNGEMGLLGSFGTVDFSFSQGGESLQLADGVQAAVLLPLYVDTLQDGSQISVGDTIPLWSLDEQSGVWVNEGVGIAVADASSPTGLALEASVGHFSWWNADALIAPSFSPIPAPYHLSPSGTPLPFTPDGAPILITGIPLSPIGPQARPSQLIPRQGSVPFPSPAGRPLKLAAFGSNGTWYGEETITGTAGTSPVVPIIMAPLDNGGGLIAYGANITVTMAAQGDTYTFVGAAGDVVALSITTGGISSLDGNIIVTSPSGHVVAEAAYSPAEAGSSRFILTESGLHQIAIQQHDLQAGGYNLKLSELTLNLITLDVGYEGSFTVPSEAQTLYFYAEAYTAFTILFEQDNLAAFTDMDLYGPNDELIASLGIFGAISESNPHQATTSGVFRIELGGDSDLADLGDYTLTVRTAQVETVVPAFPAITISDTIEAQAEAHFYAFFAFAGEVVNIDFTIPSTSSLSTRVTLLGPGPDGMGAKEQVIGAHLSSQTDLVYGTADTLLASPEQWGHSVKVETTGWFVVRIDPDVSADGTTDVGGYGFRLSNISSRSTIIVGNDLVTCPEAHTASVRGAIRAMLDTESTIELCEGTYVEIQNIQLIHNNTTIVPRNGNTTTATVHLLDGFGLTLSADSVLLSDFNINFAGHTAILLNDSDNSSFEMMRFEGPGKAIETFHKSDNFQLLDSEVEVTSSTYGVRIEGDQAELHRNRFNQLSGSFTNSTITVIGNGAWLSDNQLGHPAGSVATWGIYVQGDGALVENNQITAYTQGIFVAADTGIEGPTIRGNVLGNHIFSSGQSAAIYIQNFNFAAIDSNWIQDGADLRRGIWVSNSAAAIVNNRIHMHRFFAIDIDSPPLGSNNTIAFNTIVANAGYPIGGGIDIVHAGAIFNVTANLLSAPSGVAGMCAFKVTGPAVSFDYSLIDGFHTTFCEDAADGGNNIYAAPGFADAEFRLLSTSAAVDAYTLPPTLVFVDFEGDVRPAGNWSDIGADEYVP